jgi:hypothetical protein
MVSATYTLSPWLTCVSVTCIHKYFFYLEIYNTSVVISTGSDSHIYLYDTTLLYGTLCYVTFLAYIHVCHILCLCWDYFLYNFHNSIIFFGSNCSLTWMLKNILCLSTVGLRHCSLYTETFWRICHVNQRVTVFPIVLLNRWLLIIQSCISDMFRHDGWV